MPNTATRENRNANKEGNRERNKEGDKERPLHFEASESVLMPPVSSASDGFFRGNRKVTEEWLSRVRYTEQ